MADTKNILRRYLNGELTDADIRQMYQSGELSEAEVRDLETRVMASRNSPFGENFATNADGTIFEDIGNIAEAAFDPGADERRKAQDLLEQSVGQAKTGYGQIPETKQIEYGKDVIPFDVGEQLQVQPWEAASAGPSAYDDIGSAYEDLDVNRLGRGYMNRAAGYFEGLTKDPIDAIAEADYARRQADAEQMRRANTEAAMRELEARGQGGGGQQLLAELSNQQASVGDQYQAGLDVNAQSQARRDAAAGTAGEIGRNLWGEDARQAEARASGMDVFTTNRAAGLDTATQNEATRQQEAARLNADAANKAAELNWTRTGDVGDRNVAAQNTTNWWNLVGGPQKTFENYMDVTRGVTGAQSGQAGGLRSDAQNEFAWGPWLANQASNITKASGGGG